MKCSSFANPSGRINVAQEITVTGQNSQISENFEAIKSRLLNMYVISQSKKNCPVKLHNGWCNFEEKIVIQINLYCVNIHQSSYLSQLSKYSFYSINTLYIKQRKDKRLAQIELLNRSWCIVMKMYLEYLAIFFLFKILVYCY